MDDSSLSLTVIVPVRNEAAHIRQTLEQIYRQRLDKRLFEVIVADGESTDGTPAIVEQFRGEHPEFDLRLLNNPVRLSSGGRNLAVRHGRGEYFLLIDGHVYIPDGALLERALSLARQHGALCLGRPQPQDPPGTTPFQETVAIARQSWLAHSMESFIYSAHEGWVTPFSIGVMYHRSVFRQVGFFDESFDAAEDLEFNYRLEKAGIQCFTSPLLAVKYYPRKDLRGLFRQLRRYGLGRALFAAKHPERFHIETLVPSAFVLTLAGFCLAAPFSTPAAGLLAGLVGLYAGALAIESVRLNLKHRRRRFVLIPLIITTIHFGIGVGFLEGVWRLLRRRPAG